MLCNPCREQAFTVGRCIRRHQPLTQPLDLGARDDIILQENAQNPAKEPRTERRHRQNQPLEPHRFRHHADVILVAKGLRSRHVDHRIFCNSALLNGDFSDIFNVNGLNRVVSKAKHAED